MDVEKAINQIKIFNPLSIFIYGSCATNTTNAFSDCELGVIFDDENLVSRSQLKNAVNDANFAVFPFKYSELINHEIDTPFQKNIYIKSLIEGGAKTVFGKNIIENIKLPAISKNDLIMDASFNLGIALSAVQVHKTKNEKLAGELMYKSCLYSTRDLIYFKTNKLINGYNNIFITAQTLGYIPEDYLDLLKTSYNLRNNLQNEVEDFLYFKNISYINKFIINSIK